jgi:hypothetical protein
MPMISKMVASLVVVLALSSSPAKAAWLVKQVKPEDGKSARILSVKQVDREIDGNIQVLRSFPRYLSEGVAPTGGIYEEILYSDEAAPAKVRSFKNGRYEFAGATEVRTIVEQGPKENRINLTITGDGYRLAEKERFFGDAKRMKDELFTGKTYSAYLPLFNVYAVFVESKESGLTDGPNHQRDTALGLYRDPPGSKRGIMPGNTQAIDAAIALAPATDYPIILANDEFYGGLGGEYAITTRSVESGIVVLRHELGHNFGQVGEEYDSGGVYSGANASRSATNPSWKHWLTVPTTSHVYETKYLSGDYVWKPLSQGSYSTDLGFPAPNGGVAYDFEVILSSVGWSTPDDVYVYFDGQKVALEGTYTVDRSFFTFRLPQSPAPGKHKLEVRENIADGDNVLAFAEVYAQPDGFDAIPDEVAAYATFDQMGTKSYRPTHGSCPMRDMKHAEFCPVDKENMWTRFLARVKLVDEATVAGTGVRTVAVKTPPLPALDIRWYTVDSAGHETEVSSLQGLSVWDADAQTHGTYRVKIHFRTPEVRKYTPSFDAQKDFKL